jgi:hypothetical protein
VAWLRENLPWDYYIHGWYSNPPDVGQASILASQAELQQEPLGYFVLGKCLYEGAGWLVDKKKSFEYFQRAAELGYVDALQCCAMFYRFDDPEFFFWMGKFCALASGYSKEKGVEVFLAEAVKRVRECVRNPELCAVVFQIGASLKGHVQNQRVFGDYQSETRHSAASRAVGMHEIWCKRAREAVDAWTLVAFRFNVCKDIRLVIARLIWETRKEALHFNELQYDTTKFFDRKLMKLHQQQQRKEV